jgi:3-hydroxy-9,10-secoandrosta-1,3,5(10)-triene-9,17-dione monooxygenase
VAADDSAPKLAQDVAELVPLLAEHARQAELERKPVDAVWEAICSSGAMRAFVPERFGGFEIDLRTFMEIGINLGRGCVSTAWVTTFCMEHNWLLAQFDPQAQEEIFGQQPYIVAPGSISPNGRATPVEGGYELSGRWQWGTGVMHADWVLLAGLVDRPDTFDLRMFVIPINEVSVIDTWQVDGMVGTGSNDVEANAVFVPEHRSQPVSEMAEGRGPGALWHDSHIFRIPMLPFKCITAACPAVGAAKEAVHLFFERIQQRTLWGSGTKQSDHGPAQMRLGLLESRADSVEQELFRLAVDIEAWGQAGEPCPPSERARQRLLAARIVRESRDIVRDVVEASGASSHFLDNPLQRIHRDVHTLSCHTVFDLDVASSAYGRTLLGMEVKGLI